MGHVIEVCKGQVEDPMFHLVGNSQKNMEARRSRMEVRLGETSKVMVMCWGEQPVADGR